MYVSPWLQAALLPEKWDVCGIIVPPLSLWHVYYLRTVGNPYIVGGNVDLESATEVLHCASHTVQGMRKLLTRPSTRAMLRIAARVAKVAPDDVLAALKDYTESCTRTPGHKQVLTTADNSKPPRKIAAPMEWVVVEHIAQGNPSRMDEAWNTPYSVAFCMFDARRDVNGEVESLISEADEKRIDEKLEKMA